MNPLRSRCRPFSHPMISTSMMDNVPPVTPMPTPRGVAASPTILKPVSSAFDKPTATTAGPGSASEAVLGSRIVAARGTRLTRRIPSLRITLSRYSPGSTMI